MVIKIKWKSARCVAQPFYNNLKFWLFTKLILWDHHLFFSIQQKQKVSQNRIFLTSNRFCPCNFQLSILLSSSALFLQSRGRIYDHGIPLYSLQNLKNVGSSSFCHLFAVLNYLSKPHALLKALIFIFWTDTLCNFTPLFTMTTNCKN